jgi:hypothetical protein
VQHTYQRPASYRYGKPFPGAYPVHQPAAHGIHNGIAQDKSGCDVGVIHIAKAQIRLDGTGEYRQGITVQITQAGGKAKHKSYFPSDGLISHAGEFFLLSFVFSYGYASVTPALFLLIVILVPVLTIHMLFHPFISSFSSFSILKRVIMPSFIPASVRSF